MEFDTKSTVLMAFYGTLRRGFSLHEQFKAHLIYRGETLLSGYAMYDLGAYPMIVETNSSQDRVVAELFEIKDAEIFKQIHNIELEAGYLFKQIEVNGKSFGIYYYPEIIFGSNRVISGDWKSYTSNSEFNSK